MGPWPRTCPTEGLADALTAARAIVDSDSRAQVLGVLAPHLPAERRVEVLAEALTARAIADSYSRALGALAPLA